MQVEVTVNDILAGRQYQNCDILNISSVCPVARALSRAFSKEINVGYTVFYLGESRINLPQIATDFIFAFDAKNKAIKPFTFEVDDAAPDHS